MHPDHQLHTLSLWEGTRDIRVYGVILIDLEGIVQKWNHGAVELLGYSSEEAIGRHFEFVFNPEDRRNRVPQVELENALSSNDAYDDRWLLRKDRRRIYINGGLSLMKNEKGDPVGFIKIIRDQTDKMERLELIEKLHDDLRRAHESLRLHAGNLEDGIASRTEELKERNTELEAFCYSIAHDLRSPLRSIQAMSQVIVEDYGDTMDPTCRDYLNRICRAGSRLDQLTLDLLKYSRLARESIQLTTTSLETVIEEVISSLHEIIEEKTARIEVQHPLPEVYAQHAYLVQIFINLLSNSLKFMTDGKAPVIRIWAEAESDQVRVFVSDNGIGIPEEYQERVFHLFERLHPDGTFEGTGVGLAIASKAASRIKGVLSLVSSSQDGTTFRIDLEAGR